MDFLIKKGCSISSPTHNKNKTAEVLIHSILTFSVNIYKINIAKKAPAEESMASIKTLIVATDFEMPICWAKITRPTKMNTFPGIYLANCETV